MLEYLTVLSRYQYLISLANLFVSHVLVTSLLFLSITMATMSAVQQTTGYGPAASAANSIPEFSGDVKSFADFEFKLKAVAFEFGLEEILLRPQEWLASQEALKHRIEGRSGASTRSSSSSAPVDHAQDQAQLNAEQGKYKHLARILIGKLATRVGAFQPYCHLSFFSPIVRCVG